MTLQIDFIWFVGLLLSFFGACALVGKLLLSQTQRHLDERFAAQETARTENHAAMDKRLDAIEQANRQEAGNWQRMEREILQLKAELPLNYVRREDYVQAVATIMAKLDAMSMRFENILLRRAKDHE